MLLSQNLPLLNNSQQISPLEMGAFFHATIKKKLEIVMISQGALPAYEFKTSLDNALVKRQ